MPFKVGHKAFPKRRDLRASDGKFLAYKLTRKQCQEQRICPNCQIRPIQSGYSRCEVCHESSLKYARENREKQNARNKERYDRLRSQGLCVVCELPSGGNCYCRTCTTRAVARRALRHSRHSRNRWAKRG